MPHITNVIPVISHAEHVVPSADQDVKIITPIEPSLQQSTKGQIVSYEHVSSQITRIEQPPKSSTSFHFPLSNVNDDIVDSSALVG